MKLHLQFNQSIRKYKVVMEHNKLLNMKIMNWMIFLIKWETIHLKSIMRNSYIIMVKEMAQRITHQCDFQLIQNRYLHQEPIDQ